MHPSSELPDLGTIARASSRLLRSLVQDRCPARLGPGARRDALTLRLPTGGIGVAQLWHAVSSGTVRGEAGKGFVALEVAVPSSSFHHFD